METVALQNVKQPAKQTRPRVTNFVTELNAWIDKLTDLYSIGLSEPIVLEASDRALYAEALSDLTPLQLDAACLKAVRTCRFLPRPADILAHVDQANAAASELEAEGEWQKLLEWIRENFFPDIGIRRGAPRLAPAIEHAAKAAGGISFIERCSNEQLVWCRKNFLSAYKNVRETRQIEHLLGDGEAKKILSQLTSGPALPERKQLADREPEGKLPPRAEVRAVLERVAQIPSEEEWRRRKENYKTRIADWARVHGYSAVAESGS